MTPSMTRLTLVSGLFVLATGAFAQADAPGSPDRSASSAPCAAPPCGPAAGHPGPHTVQPAGRMRHLDADRDGQISRAELLSAHKRQLDRFDKADTNRDGVLSAEEARAWRGAPGHGRPGCPSGAAGG
jgi:hypothetical protein